MSANIDASTALYGIIGYPLGHSLSPLMHNAAFRECNINAVYLAFPMKNIINLKYSMKQFGIRGLSVTIPHKTHVKRFIDQMDPIAVQIGSVNTVVRNKSGLLYGTNTDGYGSIEAIKSSGFDIKGKKILIIGSGGSARAIAFSLVAERPVKIAMLGRNSASIRNIFRGLRSIRKHPELAVLRLESEEKRNRIIYPYEKWLSSPEQINEYDLIVQTTPMGMRGSGLDNMSPLSADYLSTHQTVFDIVYNPEVTPLIKIARTKKLEIIPGYKMLLFQGVKQFELFTGVKAPVDLMDRTLRSALKKKSRSNG